LLLDEPTNHLDLDSKDVLLDALEAYGGTLIFVSHDRYFVERLANRIVEVGGGDAHSYPGTYEEFLWKKSQPAGGARPAAGGTVARDRPQAASRKPQAAATPAEKKHGTGVLSTDAREAHAEGRKAEAEVRRQAQIAARRLDRAAKAHQARIADLESRIASCEATIKQLEAEMSSPGFYDNRAAAQPVIDRHQALMWQVGDLMHQWEALHTNIV
jgi:ATP-binding cassette subfamily F protein 3